MSVIHNCVRDVVEGILRLSDSYLVTWSCKVSVNHLTFMYCWHCPSALHLHFSIRCTPKQRRSYVCWILCFPLVSTKMPPTWSKQRGLLMRSTKPSRVSMERITPNVSSVNGRQSTPKWGIKFWRCSKYAGHSPWGTHAQCAIWSEKGQQHTGVSPSDPLEARVELSLGEQSFKKWGCVSSN